MPEKAHRSMLAKVTISPDSLTLAVLPLRLDDSGRPRVPPSQEASQILRDIATLSAALGTYVEIRGDIGYVTVQRRPHIYTLFLPLVEKNYDTTRQ